MGHSLDFPVRRHALVNGGTAVRMNAERDTDEESSHLVVPTGWGMDDCGVLGVGSGSFPMA